MTAGAGSGEGRIFRRFSAVFKPGFCLLRDRYHLVTQSGTKALNPPLRLCFVSRSYQPESASPEND